MTDVDSVPAVPIEPASPKSAYCSIGDLMISMPERTLIELSNDNPEATHMNTAIVQRAINSASELVDGYLRGRYTVPLDVTPTIIKDLVIDIARHWLYARRPEGYDFPEAVTRTYKTAIQTLESIQAGRVTLGIVPTGKQVFEKGEFLVSKRSETFSDSLLEKFG